MNFVMGHCYECGGATYSRAYLSSGTAEVSSSALSHCCRAGFSYSADKLFPADEIDAWLQRPTNLVIATTHRMRDARLSALRSKAEARRYPKSR